MKNIASAEPHALEHPRTLGWLGTSALAMGGSNQSLFLISALFVVSWVASAEADVATCIRSVSAVVLVCDCKVWIALRACAAEA